MRTDVEFLRIIAALGIVWFHSGLDVGRDIAYSGLVVFLIFSSYFAVKSNKEYSVLSRASRFLIPCALGLPFCLIAFLRNRLAAFMSRCFVTRARPRLRWRWPGGSAARSGRP